MKPIMKQEHFGKISDGVSVELYRLSNRNGVEAAISTYGGAIVSLLVPDRHGKIADVALGYDSCDGYLSDAAYLGPILGRHANRIAKGRFTLNGVTYNLARNNGEHHLHGGLKGFDKVVWKARDAATSNSQALELTYLSKDLEEGYPGNMSVRVVYALNDANQLTIEYFATSDKDTVVNLSNHTYFNLGGHDSGDILKHELMINADRFTPTDASSIPTGELRSVEGTPFDFKRPTTIGSRVNQEHEQLIYGHGYDQNFVLNRIDSSPRPSLLACWIGKVGVFSKFGRLSLVCSCTAAISSTEVFAGKTACLISEIKDSAWRHNISRIHQISRISRRPY